MVFKSRTVIFRTKGYLTTSTAEHYRANAAAGHISGSRVSPMQPNPSFHSSRLTLTSQIPTSIAPHVP